MNVKIPISTQLKSLQEAYATVTKQNEENIKLIENLKEQVAFLEQRSLTISETEWFPTATFHVRIYCTITIYFVTE